MLSRPAHRRSPLWGFLVVPPALAVTAAWMGCQGIIGISGLEVTTGVGGSSSTTTTTTSTSASTGTSGCTSAADCGSNTACRKFACTAGQCVETNTQQGTACGGTCAAGMVTPPGTCDGAGQCSSQPSPCANHYGCDPSGKACATSCNPSLPCAPDGVCFAGPSMCMECGSIPPAGPCMVTDGGVPVTDAGMGMQPPPCTSCSGDVCIIDCNILGTCDTSLGVFTASPVKILCGTHCSGITIDCEGANPCEIDCTGTGCQNLKLSCAIDGPCKLSCTDTSCAGATVDCGGNQCDVDCPTGTQSAVKQSVNNACSHTKSGCL